MLRRGSFRLQWALIATTLALTTVAAFAAPVTFRAWNDERDVIQFISKAPLEKIVGTNGRVRAEVTVEDLSDILSKKVAGKITVDLDTITTGISLRDKHMREQYLETDKYHPTPSSRSSGSRRPIRSTR
ncbi:MAG: hypothetical protein KatS3mg115_1198 [Candidatus Poribacteria bacterium]|nr:MAG: hypothetical protein KatS3mg115_1198 [Candidatus Poribacteria bacterium]